MASSVTETREAGRRLRVLLLLVATSLLVLTYARVGWWRMEEACTRQGPGRPGAESVETRWSWAPPGFTCTWSDGRTRTSLWF